MSPSHNAIVHKETDLMLAAGNIAPVESPWTSPVVLASKKDGSSDSLSAVEGEIRTCMLTFVCNPELTKFLMI